MNNLSSNLENQSWYELNQIYAIVRKKLFESSKWLLGPLHARNSANKVVYQLNKLGLSIQNKVYCDLGCGVQNPYGTSALMYINGASSAIATDVSPIKNDKRTAVALYDLLLQCLAHPDDYHLTEINREEYFSRIYNFNLKALKQEDLRKGTADIPIKHIVTSIYEPDISPESIDIMSSRAVLEHFLEFEQGCSQMYSLMKPEAVGIHFVDFVDHRAYKSTEYHYWSFLAEEEEEWSQNMKHMMPHNRLRASEIYKIFEETGFEIIGYNNKDRGEMPADFRKKIKGRFQLMSDEELSILRAEYVIKKSKK